MSKKRTKKQAKRAPFVRSTASIVTHVQGLLEHLRKDVDKAEAACAITTYSPLPSRAQHTRSAYDLAPGKSYACDAALDVVQSNLDDLRSELRVWGRRYQTELHGRKRRKAR